MFACEALDIIIKLLQLDSDWYYVVCQDNYRFKAKAAPFFWWHMSFNIWHLSNSKISQVLVSVLYVWHLQSSLIRPLTLILKSTSWSAYLVRVEPKDFERLLTIKERVRFRLRYLIRENLCAFLTDFSAVLNQVSIVVFSLRVHVLTCISSRPPWVRSSRRELFNLWSSHVAHCRNNLLPIFMAIKCIRLK